MVQMLDLPVLKSKLGNPIDIAGVDGALLDALSSAQTAIEGLLDSPLEKATDRTDVFYLDPAFNCGVTPNGVYYLRLKQAFVSDITSIKVGYKLNEIDTQIEVSQSFLGADMLMRGYVTVAADWERMYMSVTYDAGFDSNNVATQPAWLTEALVSYTQAMLKKNSPLPAAPKGESPSAMARLAITHATACLGAHHRRLGFAFYPVY